MKMLMHRVIPVNRAVPAVPRGVKGSPTKAERERILDLTSKLLVATVRGESNIDHGYR